MTHDFRKGAGGAGYHREFAGHGFGGRESESFVEGRDDGDLGLAVIPDQIPRVDFPGKMDPMPETEFFGEHLA